MKMYRAILTLSFITVILASSAFGATYHVRVGTGNSNNCSQSQTDSPALNNIQAAIDCLPAGTSGHTIIVHGGTYNPGSVIQVWSSSKGTSWANPNILKAADGETVWVQRSGTGIFFRDNHINDSGYDPNSFWLLDRINVDCQNAARDGGIVSDDNPDMRVQNVEIKQCEAGVQGFGPRFLLYNSHIHHIGLPPTQCIDPGHQGNCYGIYYGGNDGIIDGNHWHDIGSTAIQIYKGDYTNHDVTVRNNIIHDCGLVSDQVGTGMQVFNTGHKIYNNVVYNNKDSGIWTGPGQEVDNNTTYGNQGPGIYAADPGATIRNNIAFNNSGGNVSVPGGTLTNNLCNSTGGGCTSATNDVRFHNAPGGDFRLNNNSPAIDNGTFVSLVTTDADGKPRSDGSNDIGAYECQDKTAANCEGGPPQPGITGPVVELKCDGNFANNIAGGPVMTPVGGPINTAPRIVGTTGNSCGFDGVNDQLVGPNDPIMRPASFCMGVWAKPVTLPPTNQVCRLMEIGTTAALGFGDDGGLFGFINNGPTVSGNAHVLLNPTHLFGLSFDAADGMLRLWDNNANVASLPTGTTLNYGASDTLTVGGSGGATPGWCNITLDNIRLNNEPCTALGMQQWFSENPLPTAGKSSTHWRFFQADAPENTPIPGSGVDATSITVNRSGKLRLRWNVKQTNATTAAHYNLQCNLNGGVYTNLTTSCVSNPACIAADSVKNSGDATADVDQMPNDGFTFVPGLFEVDSVGAAMTTLANGQVTKWEYGLAFNPVLNDGDTVRCIIAGLDTYPTTLPIINISVPTTGTSTPGGASRGGTKR